MRTALTLAVVLLLGGGALAGDARAQDSATGLPSAAPAPAAPAPTAAPAAEAEPAITAETASPPEPETKSGIVPAAASETASETAPETTPETTAETTPAAVSEPAPEPALKLTVAAGLGYGTRSFRRPTPLGAERLPETGFAAADAEVRASTRLCEGLTLDVLLRYQGSLGLEVEARPPFALPMQQDARSQRAELSVAPAFRLGGPGAPVIAPLVGLSLRAFAPDVRNQPTPAYFLAGPHLRAELSVPITDALSLRVGPELQWIAVMNESLTQHGLESSGVAFGIELAGALRLSERFALEASLRQAHAAASHEADGVDFEDVESFATMRIVGRL